jgi:hypothetical protein
MLITGMYERTDILDLNCDKCRLENFLTVLNHVYLSLQCTVYSNITYGAGAASYYTVASPPQKCAQINLKTLLLP